MDEKVHIIEHQLPIFPVDWRFQFGLRDKIEQVRTDPIVEFVVWKMLFFPVDFDLSSISVARVEHKVLLNNAVCEDQPFRDLPKHPNFEYPAIGEKNEMS